MTKEQYEEGMLLLNVLDKQIQEENAKLRAAIPVLTEALETLEKALAYVKENASKEKQAVKILAATLEHFANEDNWFDTGRYRRMEPTWRGPNEDYPEKLAQAALDDPIVKEVLETT